MKTQRFYNTNLLRAAAAVVVLPFQMLPVAEGATVPQDIEVADIARLCVRVSGVGETGNGRVIGTEGATRYEIDGSALRIYLAPIYSLGDMSVIVDGAYGQVRLHAVISLTVTNDGFDEIELDPYTFAAIAAGGGGGGGGTNKHLLQYDGGATITENGVVLTHADIYNMLMNTPDFVVLVYADHAYHPNLVTATQIVFTCSYASTSGQVVVERVTITNANVVSKMTQYAVTENSVGGVAIGSGSMLRAGVNALAQGSNNVASGYASHAEGTDTTASGDCSHAEGYDTNATGASSHAEGESTTAEGRRSHAEGYNTTASGDYSHAEGEGTNVSGYASHAEGENTTVSGDHSHAEGVSTSADGYYSHAEGENTTASGDCSHAEGEGTNVSGYASHAEGSYTTAKGDYQHAQGTYNNADEMDGEDGAFMHGCGTGDDDRKNAFAIAADGSIYVIGLGGYDGTNHTEAQSLQEIFGASIIQADNNVNVNGYQVPQLTPEQVAQAYNSVVAGKSATITDATGNFHLGVMQADNLSGDLTISVIYLNVMLVSYTIDGGSVDIQYKNL